MSGGSSGSSSMWLGLWLAWRQQWQQQQVSGSVADLVAVVAVAAAGVWVSGWPGCSSSSSMCLGLCPAPSFPLSSCADSTNNNNRQLASPPPREKLPKSSPLTWALKGTLAHHPCMPKTTALLLLLLRW